MIKEIQLRPCFHLHLHLVIWQSFILTIYVNIVPHCPQQVIFGTMKARNATNHSSEGSDRGLFKGALNFLEHIFAGYFLLPSFDFL